jgi:NAD(P)-dependent dehydrogenase (short-subunit alcohol dehydrogenase family)
MSNIEIDRDEGAIRKERAAQSHEKRNLTVFAGRFKGRTAVITGGASGLGLACAKRFLEEGGRVSLWDINPHALAEHKKALHGAHTMGVDVCNLEHIKAAVKQSREVLGKIDILVNSAGITGAAVPVVEFPVGSWLRVLDVNLNGVFYCCREIVPIMTRQRYGRIINVASVAGKEGNPNA